MAEKSFEDIIPPKFMGDAIAILRLEHAYILRKRKTIIRLKKSLKSQTPASIVEVIKFIGGKPLKSLTILLDCQPENLLNKIKKEDDKVAVYMLESILENSAESYLSKIQYIKSEIGSYLVEEDGK